ncbi:MAG TPA: hypothetical protein VHI93_07190, partial [Candidatus Thermoplasmatota archaeon]|nr:hypothetical protein [Candidatus Thermoplasmatota archaeon]
APRGRVGAATAAMGFAMGSAMLVAPSAMSLIIQASGSYAAAFGLCMAAALVAFLALRSVREEVPSPGIAVPPQGSRCSP